MSQTPGNRRIYLSPPNLDGREKERMLAAFDSNWITTMGPEVELFEQEMCRKLDVGHAVALSSGTAGLHLALLVLGVGPGDEVICSDLTFAATVNAVKYCGAHPVLIDADPSTWNMDPGLLEEELSARERAGRSMPRAILPVDLYGQCADYTAILAIAARYGIPVVEDAAEALGAEMGGTPAGGFGAMGVLSFNGNKIITTSGGGMLVSNEASLVARARYLATQAREPVVHYQHVEVGYNYRLSNILAAIGRGQLERLEEKVRKKREVNRYYREALGGLPGIEFMPEAPYGKSNCWLTAILVDADRFGVDREGIRLALERENIESRPVWKPMHLQPAYRDCRFRGTGAGERIFERGLCLPSGAQLRLTDLERIVGVITGAGRPRS
ncbi:MAG: aminotransferase class I/II-fold pyridoxal phosphate-dependent enzyme [Acidobacteria bacterium]|nr:aminotransferase class I/II-fold pyridoxal phosphate-dependent enzyme [Acidobacteriota bacterium]